MTEEELAAYYADVRNYGVLTFEAHGDPGLSTVPVLMTGHKFKVHWGNGTGIDWDEMDMLPSQNLEPDDEPIYLVHNFTDSR